MIVKYTNKYATKYNVKLDVTPFEIRKFIGILFLSGYYQLRHWRHYWCDEYGCDTVRKRFAIERFEAIKRHINLSEKENLNHIDRYTKIRPFIDAANDRFIQFGVFSHNLAVDGYIIPIYLTELNRSACCINSNQTYPFGFKAWSIFSVDGYLYKTIFFNGDSYNDGLIDKDADAVFSLLDILAVPGNHRLYFDNFPMTYHLMCLLKEDGFFVSGIYNWFVINQFFNLLSTFSISPQVDHSPTITSEAQHYQKMFIKMNMRRITMPIRRFY